MGKELSNTLLESTAGWTAAVRAAESKREDRLFDDPWAEALAGEVGATWLAQHPTETLNAIIIRTRYFDDSLQGIANQQGIKQIVLLAAGLDTRAYRIKWPAGTRLFELDQAGLLERKEAILLASGTKPGCTRQSIAADLAGAWKEELLASGYNPQECSGWLLEGFLFYVPSETIRHILSEVSELAAPGSWLGFDTINEVVLTSPWTKPWVDMQAQAGAPWIGTLDDPESFLAELGWEARLTQAGQPDANYGRWTLPVISTGMENMPHNWLVTARKE
jgi:methyltransferase (TIGR00027 family)